MLAIEIIANKMDYDGQQKSMSSEICAVSGKETHYPVPLPMMVIPSLPGYGSSWVDYRIGVLLHYAPLRKSSWAVDNRGYIETIKGKGVREILFNPPAPPWGCYAAPDMRRPGHLLTQANTNNDTAVIQFGRHRCALSTTKLIYEAIEPMFLNHGFRKSDLSDPVEAYIKTVLGYGLSKWQEFRTWADKYAGSAEWKLAIWCLPTQDEMKEREQGEREGEVKSESESEGGEVNNAGVI